MKPALAALCLTAIALSAPARATPEAPEAAPGAAVFEELEALGFDLAKFHPDYTGRFPYR